MKSGYSNEVYFGDLDAKYNHQMVRGMERLFNKKEMMLLT